uniref:CSON010238 protein n=1 Tax=Culicoides sonorensis TaxID=179676 RepID=A0A336MYY4_CULSO
MAVDLSCAAKRKAKERSSEYLNCRIDKNDQSLMKTMLQPQQTRNGLRVYKIVILGDGGVGKSAVTLQFVSHSFLDYHDPTIGMLNILQMTIKYQAFPLFNCIIFKFYLCNSPEDSYQQQAVIDGEAALLDILDTAGQVEFTAMRDQYMRCGEGFIICYSVTDRHSFQEASEYRRLIARVRLSEDIPLVLVANKVDLESQRRVSTQEGKALAGQFGGCPFFETSAALRHYIDEAFFTLVREIRKKENGRSIENGITIEKIESKRRGRRRWWRLRSIFALVFRKKRNTSGNNNNSTEE